MVYQDSLYSGFQSAAELRLKTGETNRLEMISARSQSLEIKNQLRQLNADLMICNQKLQAVLNVETALYPVDTVLRRIEYLPAVDNPVLTGNPSVGYVNQQTEVTRLEKKLESSRILPELSIGYFSQTIRGSQEVNGIPRTFGGGDRFTGIQAGIAVPIWFVPYSAKTKAARFKEKAARANAANYSKSLSGSYRSLLLEFRKNTYSVDYYEKQAIPEADLIIEQASKSYKAGAMDYLEYILSLNRALGIKQNYLDALNSYNQTIISIDFITGKIL